ncbi:hypothetical protein [Falsiroseomonas selenitidurans]|uniref:Uncharacterized protein n=1 Tax=Falsiroseomonas selenitidurans TaxID=2716335 RepID=A0ABX1ECI2_9PROT|nr:hypothetical protein [Falsiroseomonas selenitidurans]NKC33473.1 hypothetical protein [Falsiroseomonas selenitidurans]
MTQIVYLQHLAGEPRQRVPLPEPAGAYVTRPQRILRDAFGAVAYVAAGSPTDNRGHGQVLAWLVPPGCTAPDYAEVRFPSGAVDRHVPVAWLHDPHAVAQLRPAQTPARRISA